MVELGALTEGDLSGEGHGHQQQRQPHRHELDEAVEGQFQVKVAQADVAARVPHQGVGQHGLSGCVGDGHGCVPVRAQKWAEDMHTRVRESAAT